MAIEIVLRNISKHYGVGKKAVVAVDKIDLTIRPGELFFLLGPSGCGKTTLLHLIAGLSEPTDGKIFFGKKDITDLPPEKRCAAMVFQNYALWPHMTVMENVLFGPKMQGLDKELQYQRAKAALDMTEMTAFAQRKPTQLSGGQQQRAALARALAANPKCLLLDEPLSNLDAKLRHQMRQELRHLIKSSDITAIYVTHDQTEALAMADRLAVMQNGKIIQVGTPNEIYNHPRSVFCAEFIGKANLIEGTLTQKNPSVVQTAVGPLHTDDNHPFAVQQRVICCIRPEHIRIAKSSDKEGGITNTLPATFCSATYLGAWVEIDWQINNRFELHTLHLSEEVQGQRFGAVMLTIAAEKIALLPLD